ncbi:transcriptional regulator family: Bromodomain transcription factor [Paecilomyces variotii]|nr:transcriptional regulator family: Bromodomain transcription factor [Paecilomyces variotii]KAJ9230373.1 transcriptional regulator family: Bromodomain transcription factor [Paecilomyces variotii]KAJ9296375.1 transcriptional regulator family: Bromodomain transcription factor [Paecilomyces variotii]KAJ9367667.1 transcriptional regulator family: Bromodomain transcription factor [Paecilomyces variotii]
MSLAQHHAWLPPGHLRPPDDHNDVRSVNGLPKPPQLPRTPQTRVSVGADGSQTDNLISESDTAPDEDPRIAMFREQYKKSEAKIGTLFSKEKADAESRDVGPATNDEPETAAARAKEEDAPATTAPKKSARKIDEDDYDEYDEEEEEQEQEQEDDEDIGPVASPVKVASAAAVLESSADPSPGHRPSIATADSLKDIKKETVEEIRKKLEEDKKATEEAAKRSFHTMFYTLENDRDAMLDQQRLEESERQVEAEMSGQGVTAGANTTNTGTNGYGSLSSANLGASSLTLKNLIARIDMKRNMVQASDAELRSLMSEVRKNRSKWASEDKIGQEELYEAAEKVLSELKAQTEHSTAFLTRVNKREAPDYYNIIKHPMDLGTMTKKLKALQYKSKQEFVDDLNLIWANCLKYNANPDHFLRKHALYMRKETEKLVPLIPDIVIRDRAEVEAEERRQQLAEMDGAEESDDEPIMSSRGRKAPGKTSKKGAGPSRETPQPSEGPQGPPQAQSNAFVRSDSDAAMDGSQNGFATPPPGTLTPLDAAGGGAPGSQTDAMDIDGFGPSSTVLSALSAPGIDAEDPEYKVWKQVTKKDRALIAAERHRLFKGDKLNSDEPALLRTKAGMRRWLRNQKRAAEGEKTQESNSQALEPVAAGETLAEGIEVEDKVIPDYYDVMSGIPDLPDHLLWREDAEGNVVDASEEFLRILPKGSFTAPDSKLSRKMDANMRQMQETRKICSKIGIVKQMQLQSQMYQNQFQKYNPEPFVEQDVPTHVMNDEGPVIAPWVCKAALQRSVGKLFYHAGFEEYQPSALDAVTDIASDFFKKIGETFKTYMEAPKVPVSDPLDTSAPSATQFKPAYTEQEIILHTLSSVGIDVESLESYIKDDVERLGTKLGVVHDRLRAHLTELLRPALADGGADGSNAFHDGSEQFIGGDFAEDIDEDFFGFKELGLDKEFGLSSLSVPLHLLQNRMYNAAQAQNTNASQATSTLFPPPPPYPRISLQTLSDQIGLVQNFFRSKLQANNDEPLVEDLELPPKQRPTVARPRLPASGKITAPLNLARPTNSPQKRPLPASAPNQAASARGSISEPSKKKVKKNSGAAGIGGSNADAPGEEMPVADDMTSPTATKSVSKLKLNVPGVNVASAATSLDNSSAKSGLSDSFGGEGSTNSHSGKVNGTSGQMTNGTVADSSTATAGSNVDGSGNHGAGMISPESIDGPS